MTDEDREQQAESPGAPTLWQAWMSVMAAFFGVQSSANRERDAARGNAAQFILLGLLATALLVAILIAIVVSITHFAGV